ncbi:MAG: patatin-like phospholipase family protein [Proteobacteria bacterium]|nr:patatin-like phospholipase family protein [Pseudomonadota bacterium]
MGAHPAPGCALEAAPCPDGPASGHAPCADAPAPPVFDDQAPPDRFCDLVLTGGVTSSIAYPALLLTLASRFRFHSIGGSSSGAGAAALAAAAEYRRRHGSAEGFRVLLARTSEVRDWVDEARGITRLRQLFQPWAHSRRLFDALVPVLAQPDIGVGALAGALWRAYVTTRRWVAFALGLAAAAAVLAVAFGTTGALAAAFGHVARWLSPGEGGSAPLWLASAFAGGLATAAGLLAAVLGGVGLAAGAWALRTDLQRLIAHDFGLCSGTAGTASAAEVPAPLTDWLHGLIQEIAGRSVDAAPLNFADLRQAPASPRALGQGTQEMDAVSIRLQVYAANLTLGQPLVLPLRKDDDPVYFVPREMRRLFPDAVVDAMKTQRFGPLPPDARAALHRPTDRDAPAGQDAEDDLWTLPRMELPIVVAARMSVSAPLLFAPVPVWMLDREHGDTPRRCLLSDGGLCSNFPIHMFDCAVPSWPTFGVALRDAPRVPGVTPQVPDMLTPAQVRDAVSLPEGRARARSDWNRFIEEPSLLRRTMGFLGALLGTAKDWNDALLAQMPGVRDRIVRIELPPGIGGLNIAMTPRQIQALSDLGQEAAHRLLTRFAPPGRPDGTSAGWAEHRWMRLQLLREALAELLAGAHAAAARNRYAGALRTQIADATVRPPVGDVPTGDVSTGDARNELLSASQAAVLQGALDAVLAAEAALTGPAEPLPRPLLPRPVLRLRPPL